LVEYDIKEPELRSKKWRAALRTWSLHSRTREITSGRLRTPVSSFAV